MELKNRKKSHPGGFFFFPDLRPFSEFAGKIAFFFRLLLFQFPFFSISSHAAQRRLQEAEAGKKNLKSLFTQ